MGTNSSEGNAEQRFIEKTKKFSDAELALICNRAALRILPLVSMKTIRPVDQLSPQYFSIDLFCALLVSRVLIFATEKADSLKGAAIKIEESIADLSQKLYKEFDFAASTGQVHLAGSLNMARITADACLHSLRWAIRMRWYFKIDASPASYYEITGEEEYSRLVELDVTSIVEKKMSASELYSQPLWEPEGTEHLQERWNKLKETLIESDENWTWWINWYECAILGGPINIDEEYKIVTIIEKYGRSDFYQLNKIVSEKFRNHTFHKEKSRSKKLLKSLSYRIRQLQTNFESGFRKIALSVLNNLRHMGGGNVIAGIAVILTIITAILAFL